MSGETYFPRPDYIRMGWSHPMMEHMRWLTEAACAATGATPGDFSTFGDQEDIGAAYDYRPPAESFTEVAAAEYRAPSDDALAAGLGEDTGALVAAISRLSSQVQDLCITLENRDNDIVMLRRRIRDLELQVEGI